MLKIMFVCHGNICRSPMAEYIFREKSHKIGLDVFVSSAATSTEEIGNPVHYGTKRILDRLGIDSSEKRAVQLKKSDYYKYDMFIGMDEYNIKNMLRIFGGDPDKKVSLLMSFASINRSVADPWYSGDFETAYYDIDLGCDALLQRVK